MPWQIASAQTVNLVITGASMPASSQNPNGQPESWNGDWEQWGNGYVEILVNFPISTGYTFTLNAFVKPGGTLGALSEVRLDQKPIAFGNTFSQLITALNPTNYTWSSYVPAGTHKIQISLMNHDTTVGVGNLMIQSLTIANNAASAYNQLPVEPAGTRDPWLQPYSSYSVWNTSIGSTAQWSVQSDADVIDLHHSGYYINAGMWSYPFYQGATDQAQASFTVTDNTYPIPNVMLNLPAGASPSYPVQGGDHHMVVYSPDKKSIYHFFNCNTVSGGFGCGQSQMDNACGEALGGYGWGAGVIRAWELQAGTINHVLRYALPTSLTKAGTTWTSGLAWPAMRSDYSGPNGLYTGHVLYGTTIGLPGGLNINSMGLTPSGLALAAALQNYGAIQRDTGGTGGLTFYAEQSTENMSQLADMRNDLAKIVPHLEIIRNNSPTSVQGGGTRRKPLLPGLDPTICPANSNY
jgi:hypothetical protein